MRPEYTDEQKDAAATAIAWQLGVLEDGWGPAERAHYCRRITHVRGHGVSIRWENGRVIVRGIYPTVPATERRGAHEMVPAAFGERSTTITAAANKAPGAIANDIWRRFLPAYLPVYRRLAAAAA